MMRAILFIILILWMFGVVTDYTLGGLIHLLLLLAAIVLFIDLIDRRKWL
ncbi:MAG TPA: lmo0937 family membrane protein [Candidatus Binatia bacterium]|nr:lmo0937 family membrane protein [Candidatus Binatia bacterium]